MEASMKLAKAQSAQLEKIVAISKRAFESDVEVGGVFGDYPPEYDSVTWHEKMLKEGHLFQAIVDDEVIGGAILFLSENKESLYVGRIFVDCIYHKKGYGITLMQLVETYYSSIKKIKLDTPLWNVRTNAFYKKLGYREVKRDEQFAYYQKDFE